jgi:chlorite dismutase
MAEVPGTLEGWYVLHDFRRIDWPRWKALRADQRKEAVAGLRAYLAAAEAEEQGSTALFSVVGHKADLLFLHLRPTIQELGGLERAFERTAFADFTTRADSYLSVTELSLYEAYARGGTENAEELREKPFVQQRLYFKVPDMEVVCFYPMNKRRGEAVNWYAAPMEDRRVMMREHGSTGAKYRGRVQQMITGSMGLDDWEWGVTLFAHDALDIKKLVYEMRFDEVSAKYGEFGEFLVGTRVRADGLEEQLLGGG